MYNDTRIKKDIKCNHIKHKDLIGFTIHNIRIISEDGFDLSYGRKRRKWKYECLLCGKIISYTAEVIKRGDIKSCGDHMPSGPNHHRYNPNTDRHRRDSYDYKKWSKAVLKKSGYRCCICNKNYKLRAHHLDGWKWAIDKRFDVNNGVCCCIDCHNRFHKIYGSGENTREQFIEYYCTIMYSANV